MTITPRQRTLLYCATCRSTGKLYVGVTSLESSAGRWKQHVYDATRNLTSSVKFQRAIRKYGAADFYIVDLFWYDTREAACAAEVALISQLDLQQRGYNSSEGGDGGATRTGQRHTEATRQLMSATAKAQNRKPANTPEAHRKTADALRGRKRPPEVCAKIAAGHLGRKKPKWTQEARDRLSISLTGLKRGPKQRAAISAGLRASWARRRAQKHQDAWNNAFFAHF